MPSPEMEDIARELLRQGKSYFVEYISAWEHRAEGPIARRQQDIAREIGETVVAFANSDGGDLLVGVESTAEVTGIPHEQAARRYFVQAPQYQVESPDFGVRVHEIELGGKRLLLFRVVATSSTIAATAEGRCLWRKDDTNRPVAPYDIERRRQDQRGDTHYETEPVRGATVDDLNFPAHPRIEALLRSFHDDPECLLRYWNLAEGRNGHLVLKRAALLLFAREPLRWHPNNRIRFFRVLAEAPGFGQHHRTQEHELLGPITRLIEPARDHLRGALSVQTRRETLFSAEQILPPEATDECLINALVHRNYAIEGAAIEVFLYPSRVEFHSPGTLPKPLTIADLRRQQGTHRSRNPLLMRVMRDLGFTLDQGEGMRRIFGAMSQQELDSPELEERAGSFIVRLSTRSRYDEGTQEFLAAYGPFGLLPRQRKYVVALSQAPGQRRSVDKLARDLGVPFDTAKRELDALAKLGIVWHAPRSRAYRLVQPLNVLHERFYRLIARVHARVESHVVLEGEALMGLLPSIGAAWITLDRLRESGILEPVGRDTPPKRWRLGPSFRAYLAQRI